jgi:histidinol phosphatase-like enzyme (inositol monophosphatase family)
MIGDPGLRAELIGVAHALADAAAGETLPRFRRRDLAVEDKGAAGFDPVTEADRAAEAAMRAVLAERRPRDGILGEEEGAVAGESGLTWVLDPIDGTRAYVCGAPVWGTLVAVGNAAGPAYGIVDQPYTGERFSGGFGRALLRRGKDEAPLSVRSCTDLAEATLLTTHPGIGTEAERAAFDRLAGRVRLLRHGLDCYGYALVASGFADLVVEAGLQPYDVQAPMALVEAAGGVVTAWDGGPAAQGGRVIAAGDPALHTAALEVLSAA